MKIKEVLNRKICSSFCWQSVDTDATKNKKTRWNEHGRCKLLGSSSRKLSAAPWSVPFVCSSSTLATMSFQSHPENYFFPLSFLPRSSKDAYIETNPQTPRGLTPSLRRSVHLLSAGQHCLLQEGEHEEDARPLPPLPLREVIGHHVICEENAQLHC